MTFCFFSLPVPVVVSGLKPFSFGMVRQVFYHCANAYYHFVWKSCFKIMVVVSHRLPESFTIPLSGHGLLILPSNIRL
jgi:hypothetical protein